MQPELLDIFNRRLVARSSRTWVGFPGGFSRIKMNTTKIVVEADDPVNFLLGKFKGLGDERNRSFVHIRL